ncbi:MAG: hypothetical protein WHS65_09210 [Melioribacteraceae bacterium]
MKKYLIYFLFFCTFELYAQVSNFNAGIYAGIGEIKGNTSSIASVGGSLFFDFNLWFSDDVFFRTGFSYFRKIEYFIPEERMGRYYPFIKSFSLKGMIQQNIYQYFFMEEGFGIIYLNDRTLSDTNVWQPGISFSLTAGIDFWQINKSNFQLGLGLDYGMGFTKTNANYYIIYLQGRIKL